MVAAVAGQVATAGRVPGERIATTTVTSDSSTFTTTETEVASVTAALVSGRTYRVRYAARFGSTVAADWLKASIREDDTSGTVLTNDNMILEQTSTSGWPVAGEAEYTAASTADKTFVLTGDRISGTGDCRLEAAATHPTYLTVDYIR
jgi:hypothetical protein